MPIRMITDLTDIFQLLCFNCEGSIGRQRNFSGEHFWVRGYFVSTVGLDKNMVCAYIRNQDEKVAAWLFSSPSATNVIW